MVVSATPLITEHRSRTQSKAMVVRIPGTRPLEIARQVVLMADHMSVDSVSRARRALSRAASRVATIEASDARSDSSSRSIARWSTGPSCSTPMMPSSSRQDSSSSTKGSSMTSWVCTSRMRAVTSARST